MDNDSLFLEYFTPFCVCFFFQDQESKIGDLPDFNFFLLTCSANTNNSLRIHSILGQM